jgi:hypothetical protein
MYLMCIVYGKSRVLILSESNKSEREVEGSTRRNSLPYLTPFVIHPDELKWKLLSSICGVFLLGNVLA